MIAPASGFYSTKGEGKNQIRLAYVLNKEKLIRCVEILKMALISYQK
jgi:aspartate aminotransferase